ncbi:F-box domain-containing protein [Myriangium duriaei CBS 260.36]|uniref:F-box domain-containing protein n=1 Tax=Myriangium duriaei CBS 260.36 TaxID=1168546 RepID=A0A9P4JAM8_9PEZI|nr:F-box domain-containing protein [Myriangium duriaei CBS 260.36]
MKRARDEEPSPYPGQLKRTRLDSRHTDRVSKLSHELTLRILSNLSVNDLAVCHRVSRHFRDLSSDSQLWKAHYYNRFVRPRAARIPSVRSDASGDAGQQLHFSSKLSKWLDEDKLVRKGRETNWKRQYKLRHNWAQGTCSVSEIPVSDTQSVPPLLVAMQDSTIILADRDDGLRAWGTTAGKGMLASLAWDEIPGHDAQSPPSALAVDMSKADSSGTKLAIGFQDGSFALFSLDHSARKFRSLYRHAASSNGMLSAVALSYPHLATMTATQLLSVYAFPSSPTSPTLIHSLHSTSVLPPLTLSIRPTPTSILIAISYALPSYLRGWTLGIQELHLDPATSALVSSRLATAHRPSSPSATEIHTLPTALSYSHPYLLAAHPDNTLSLYLVSSDAEGLRIAPPTRLWGHTSAVTGATIGGRGRAVSVTRGADEVRVWDLEGRVARAKAEAGDAGVRVVPARKDSGVVNKPCGLDGKIVEEDVCLSRGWVGFDEESVVLLKERAGCGQSLVVYDFA